MNGSDVLFCLTGSAKANSRALRQIKALSEIGLTVEVLDFGGSSSLSEKRLKPVRHRSAPLPQGSGPGFFRRVHSRFLTEARNSTARILHASDVYCLPALARAASERDAFLTYDARELYPFVQASVGRPWVSWHWRRAERDGIRAADHVFTVNRSTADILGRSYGVHPPTVFPNLPVSSPSIEAPATGLSDEPSAPGSTFLAPTRPAQGSLRSLLDLPESVPLALHQGQMREGRGCENLVAAVPDVPDVVVVFMGGGDLRDRLAQLADESGVLERVRFLDPVPPHELHHITASADIGVTLLEPTCLNHFFARPNKLFEYAFAGLPVLGADLPEVRRVVEGFDIGTVADSSDCASIARGLNRMFRDRPSLKRWSGNCTRVRETFDPDRASQLFSKTFLDLLS